MQLPNFSPCSSPMIFYSMLSSTSEFESYVLLPAMSAHDANNDLVILDMVAGVWRNLVRLVIHVLVCTSWSPSIPLGSFLFVDSDWPVRQLGV